MGALNVLAGGAKAAAKAKPLVSKFDEALANIQRPKGTGNEFLTEVMKQAGVKKAEVKDRKLREAFESAGKMTKEQAQELARKNPATKLEEKTLRDPTDKELADRAHEMAYDDAFDELRAEGINRHEAADIAAEMAEDRAEQFMNAAAEELSESGMGGSPYHGNFKLPGGSNYREILLKMPAFEGDKKISEIKSTLKRIDPEFHSARHKQLTDELAQFEAQKAAMPAQFAGNPSHFGGEPGIIASIRVQDRVGPNGEKILHVEEIQSDWHQKAREIRNQEVKRIMEKEGISKKDASAKVPEDYGYGPRIEKSVEAYYETKDGQRIPVGFGKTKEEAEASIDIGWKNLVDIKYEPIERKIGEGVPDAPFKKNWHEVALKKAINYATENGYDKIAITPGAEQASRYSLAQHVDNLFSGNNGDGTWTVSGTKNGESVFNQDRIPQNKLADYVGKEAAEKIIDSGQGTRLSGLDLQVGGGGMKGFYDKMIPDYLNSFGKERGTQMGVYDMPNPKTGLSITDIQREQGMTEQQWLDLSGDEKMRLIDEMDAKAKANTTPLHTFDISPQLREEVTTKGLPLYQQIGLPIGAGTAASELELPEYAEGGIVADNTQPDMNDGGAIIQGPQFKRGGKVKITDNLDQMFMEVNDKKFQRK